VQKFALLWTFPCLLSRERGDRNNRKPEITSANVQSWTMVGCCRAKTTTRESPSNAKSNVLCSLNHQSPNWKIITIEKNMQLLWINLREPVHRPRIKLRFICHTQGNSSQHEWLSCFTSFLFLFLTKKKFVMLISTDPLDLQFIDG